MEIIVKNTVPRFYGPHGVVFLIFSAAVRLYLNVYRISNWLATACWQACYKTCLQYFIIKTCGCGDCWYPLNATAFGGAQRACDISNTTEGESIVRLPLRLIVYEQEAQLSQRDRAVSLNLVNCITAIRNIQFEKGRNRRVTLNVTQCHRNCRCSIYHFLLMVEHRLYPAPFREMLSHVQCTWLTVTLRSRSGTTALYDSH